MCRKLPETPEQFLNVSGVGSVKMKKYGEAFIAVIRGQVHSVETTHTARS
jgi:ATP-dependent DNA helicase RecQ